MHECNVGSHRNGGLAMIGQPCQEIDHLDQSLQGHLPKMGPDKDNSSHIDTRRCRIDFFQKVWQLEVE